VTRNVAELILSAGRRRPEARFGIAESPWELGRAISVSTGAAEALHARGVAPGSRVALIGGTSMSYLLAWLALQLLGAEAALLNPQYPDELLAQMLTDLRPETVICVGRSEAHAVPAGVRHIHADDLDQLILSMNGEPVPIEPSPRPTPGLERNPLDTAGYMHTSGTSGVPKFCVQTHEYFVRLGRFVADSLCLSRADTVLAPLPMFHINPLGYGVVAGLTGNSDILTVARFSAGAFWPTVVTTRTTVLILHAPHVAILNRASTEADARDHRVRLVFYADESFLARFAVPLGVSCYGSTEAGGLSHTWIWRQGQDAAPGEVIARYGGRCRDDLTWRLNGDGEILVKELQAGTLFSGYVRGADIDRPLDEDGWFHTGDLGRIDEVGNLIFVERTSESIRVKGEFVPIGYVETTFAAIDGLDEVALWRRPGELGDDELILYVVGDSLPIDDVRRTARTLPDFMRPRAVVRVAALPRDTGVGKLRRRELADSPALDDIAL
jgi:acyl-CoA synthetase (AMP-forming)/AMP-acid ligase II